MGAAEGAAVGAGGTMASVGKALKATATKVNETVSRSVSVPLQTLLSSSFLSNGATVNEAGGPSPLTQKLVTADTNPAPSVGISSSAAS